MKKGKNKNIDQNLKILTDTDDSEFNPFKTPLSGHSQRTAKRDINFSSLDSSNSDADSIIEVMKSEQESKSVLAIKCNLSYTSSSDDDSDSSNTRNNESITKSHQVSDDDSSDESGSSSDNSDLHTPVQIKSRNINKDNKTSSLSSLVTDSGSNDDSSSSLSSESDRAVPTNLNSPNTSLGTSGLFFSPLRTPYINTSKADEKKLHHIDRNKSSSIQTGSPNLVKPSNKKNKKTSDKSPSKDLKKHTENIQKLKTASSNVESPSKLGHKFDRNVVPVTDATPPNLRYVCPPHYKSSQFNEQNLWKEDLVNSELWLVKLPSDVSSLNKTKIDAANIAQIEIPAKKKNDIWQIETLASNSTQESPYGTLLPCQGEKVPKFVGKFKGEIHITRKISTEPSTVISSKKEKHKVPEGLKMRNIPFGADGPVPALDVYGRVPEAIKRRSHEDASILRLGNKCSGFKVQQMVTGSMKDKKKRKLEQHSSDIDISSESVKQKKKKKKHKQNDHEKSNLNSLNIAEKEVVRHESGKKKKKKHDKNDKEEILNSDLLEPSHQGVHTTEYKELDDFMGTKNKKKKKKDKHKKA